jgi:hypothetical protein
MYDAADVFKLLNSLHAQQRKIDDLVENSDAKRR